MVRGSGWRVGEPACAYFLLICSNDICGDGSTSAGKCSGAGVGSGARGISVRT